MLRRLVLIPLLSFGFGFAIATVKGQGGGLLDAVGNLSAPCWWSRPCGTDLGCCGGDRHDLAGFVEQFTGQECHVLAPADDPAPSGQGFRN
jgi:hypothetical protein